MDNNKIALDLSIAALLLVVPLGIASNLMTPYVKDWYATTTQRRLRSRIAALEHEYEYFKDKPTFTQIEWAIYQRGVKSSLPLALCINLLFLVPLSALITFLKLVPAALHMKDFKELTVLVLVCTYGGTISGVWSWTTLSDYRNHFRKFTDAGRAGTRLRIEELKKKVQ